MPWTLAVPPMTENLLAAHRLWRSLQELRAGYRVNKGAWLGNGNFRHVQSGRRVSQDRVDGLPSSKMTQPSVTYRLAPMRNDGNRLAELRGKRGFSAASLAKTIGVSRQTIYAMEAGDYVPNTAVALNLARALETSVEEIFSLPDAVPPPTQQATLMPDAYSASPGTRVQLCRVDETLIASASNPVQWCFAPSDGAIATYVPNRKVKLHVLFHAEHEYRNRVSIAGCDPAVTVLAGMCSWQELSWYIRRAIVR